MRNYHNLENEVLSIFRQINDEEDNKEIAKLLNVFQKYWKSYQDNWPSRYWDIYNLVYEESYKCSDNEKNQKETDESSKNNLKENQFKINNLSEESLICLETFKNGIEKQNEIDKEKERENNRSPFFLQNESLLKNYCQQKKKRKEKDSNNSLKNLDDIEKELDNLEGKSSKEISDKNKKNRDCFDDCMIF